MLNDQKLCEMGRAVIDIEAQAIIALKNRIDDHFAKACHYCLTCTGRIIVLGMGKSGHVGNKIAATLASTGSPAFFVHPAEAQHGDLGMITRNDVILALSNSGETSEILNLLPLIKWLEVPLISITGDPHSTLAKAAHANLNVSVEKEACPLGLAPTASSSASLVMGDALAIALLQARGFTVEDFARAHPGGILGRRLLLRISELMRTGIAIPQVSPETSLSAALLEMSQKGMGMTAVVDASQKLMGIFTDGDLRRALDQNVDIHRTPISQVMTTSCKSIPADLLAIEALKMMKQFKITALMIIDEAQKITGAIHMHDLLRAGVV